MMGKLTDGQAIVKLQTQMEQVQTDVTILRSDTGKILNKLEDQAEAILTFPQHYMTQDEAQKRFETLERQIKALYKRNVIQHAISAGIGIIFGAVVAAMSYALFVGRGH